MKRDKYKLVFASPIEIGIVRNDIGLQTWWISTLTSKKLLEIVILVKY